MRNVKVIIGVFFLLCSMITKAQQDVQFTHFKEYMLYYNPAYAGVANNVCADILARHQWQGLEGAPKSYFFDVRYAVRKLHGGIGLSVLKDELGFQRNTEVNGAYSFTQRLSNGAKLNVGLSLGVKHAAWGVGYIPPDTYQDNSIPFGGKSDAVITSGLGMYYSNSNIYVGLSSTNLNQSKFSGTSSSFNYKNVRHYYVLGGYLKQVSRVLQVEPSVFAKSDAVSTQIDLSFKAIYNQKVYAALNYRVSDAVSPQIGMYFSSNGIRLTASYSYDLTLSRLQNYSNGSHELRLSACIKLQEIFPERYVDPRDLGGL